MIIFILICTCSVCIASEVSPISENGSNIEATSEDDNSDVQSSYEFISSDLYTFNTDVTISQIVDGNVFALGDNVTISGEIGGDVFVLADNITFTDTSYIHGNIFAFANTLNMEGLTYDLYAICNEFNLSDTAIIARDIRITTTKTTIGGSIKRNAYITTNAITFTEGATALISGNLNYSSINELTIPDGVVTGEVIFSAIEKEQQNIGDIISSHINTAFSATLYTIVITLLAIWIAPTFINKAPEILKQKAPKAFLAGLLGSILLIVIPIAFIFITNGLGIGISFALIVLFILALTISKSIFSISVAKLLTNKFKWEKPYIFVIATALITLIISIINIVPYIGAIISFAVSMIGFGILILNLIRKKTIQQD